MSRYDQFNTQRRMRKEQFVIKPANISTGTAAQDTTNVTEGAYRCKVQRIGTGSVELTFKEAFLRTPVVQLTAMHATSKLFPTLVSYDKTKVRFAVFSDAGTATDPTEVHLTVTGADTVDAQG